MFRRESKMIISPILADDQPIEDPRKVREELQRQTKLIYILATLFVIGCLVSLATESSPTLPNCQNHKERVAGGVVYALDIPACVDTEN